MKKTIFALLAISLVGLLAACEVTISGNGGNSLDAVPSGQDYTDLTPRTFRIDDGDAVRVRFDLGTTDRSGAFFVVDQGSVVLYDASDTALASSSSGLSFAAGLQGLSGSSQLGVDNVPAFVSTSCVGPCIIVKPEETSRFVTLEIRNDLGADRTIELYAFGQDLDDVTEPENDDQNGADSASSGVSGAIETIGDEDWFAFAGAGGSLVDVTLFGTTTAGFPASEFLTLEAGIYDENGDPVPAALVGGVNPAFVSPDSSHVFSGVATDEFLRVRSVDPQAAASEYSKYSVQVD